MRKLSNTNFYSLKDSEDIFLIHKENKNFIKYKEFVSDIVKSLEYISKFEEDTITVFIEDAYKFIAVIAAVKYFAVNIQGYCKKNDRNQNNAGSQPDRDPPYPMHDKFLPNILSL